MTDGADMVFTDVRLFNGFPKQSPETNCRCIFVFVILALVVILFDRMLSSYVRRLAKKSMVIEKSKLNLLVSRYFILFMIRYMHFLNFRDYPPKN